MYFMYVDESGDTGLVRSNTRFYVLCGVVVHVSCWQHHLDQLLAFRRRMRNAFGLRLREEIHCGRWFSRPGKNLKSSVQSIVRIRRNDRLTIVRGFVNEVVDLKEVDIISVVVDKQAKPANYRVFDNAWSALIQRFENTLGYGNFRGPRQQNEQGVVFHDRTQDKEVRGILRRMRRFNPISNDGSHLDGYRNIPVAHILEDPVSRESDQSYFVQMADLAAFLLYQRFAPSAYMRTTGGKAYFDRLKPVLFTKASRNDPDGMGIVRL